ncbi:MAG: excinuclease ABC subunit UvrA [Pseudomonadota bacterium]
MEHWITVRGARQHNLKDIHVSIPRHKLVVITGLSGSGKSSLAFDTLYAEGQRRYVESLSTYARQFLERLEKPDVDAIDGLSPAIAIEQKSAGHNPRSTVGTVTEVYDYLRLLYARVGTPHCHHCHRPITAMSITEILDTALSWPSGTRIVILSPLAIDPSMDFGRTLRKLRKDGFARIRMDGEIFPLDPMPPLPATPPPSVDVVVDRLILKDGIRNRLADSLELALSLSGGAVILQKDDAADRVFNEHATCPTCGMVAPPLSPAVFSFNSPHGACKHCEGLGTTAVFDEERIVPDPHLSLRDGAVSVWANRSTVRFMDYLEAVTAHYGVDIYTPYKELPASFRHVLMHGSGSDEVAHYVEHGGRRERTTSPVEGVISQLQLRYRDPDAREEIKRFMAFKPCAACNGSRLNPASSAVKIAGKTIQDITAMTVSRARTYFRELILEGQQAIISDKIVREISERITFLENVGLNYLTLDRGATTLSGGESQRIRLATQIGSKLSGVMYILDEPSIGLHQRDNDRLRATLAGMRDLGNSVIVVEHDEDTIRGADHIIELGPGAGVNGGHVVFSGTPAELMADTVSLTGRYLSGRLHIDTPARRRSGTGQSLIIRAADANNLKKIDALFPLGTFICVTGVSGSGKSTLVLETLYRALARHLHHARHPVGRHESMEGAAGIDKVIHIDQSPIGKTPRSNPGTYTGIFTHIRELFSRTPESRARGYKSGRFSFNIKGGRCEACCGDGIVKIEMHFLPDVYVTCDACAGRRYNRETLDIRYRGKSISDVLDMTVNQAVVFFSRVPSVMPKLQTLGDVGLGYVRLGQPATTLSGGEAQRVKLARELSRKDTGNTLYILDEPTTGLHVEDIRKLLEVLNRLVDAGNTVVVIEHHMDVIKTADHLIDLGPEGGDAGGWIVASGTPEAVAACPESHTGVYLKRVLDAVAR